MSKHPTKHPKGVTGKHYPNTWWKPPEHKTKPKRDVGYTYYSADNYREQPDIYVPDSDRRLLFNDKLKSTYTSLRSPYYWNTYFFKEVKDFTSQSIGQRSPDFAHAILYQYLVKHTDRTGKTVYRARAREIREDINHLYSGGDPNKRVMPRLKPDFLDLLREVNLMLYYTRIGSPYDRGWYRLYRQATTDGLWGKGMEEVLEFTPVIVRDLLSPSTTNTVEDTTLFQQ